MARTQYIISLWSSVEVDRGLKAVFTLTQSRALLKWTHFKLGGQQPLTHAAAKPLKITGEVSQLLLRSLTVRCVFYDCRTQLS